MRYLFLILALMLPLSAHADDEKNPRLISVNGSAEKIYEPNKVEINIGLQGEDKDLKKAKSKHDDLLNALYAVAEKFGVEKKDIKTLSNSIQPRYEYRDKTNQRVLAGYLASHQVQVMLKNLDKIGDFINALTAKGIDQMNGMQFGLIDSNAAEREVMLMAVKDARAKADAVAGVLGVGIERPYSINVSGGGGYHPQPMMARGMVAMAADAEMAPAAEIPMNDVTIRQSVSAQFEMK